MAKRRHTAEQIIAKLREAAARMECVEPMTLEGVLYARDYMGHIRRFRAEHPPGLVSKTMAAYSMGDISEEQAWSDLFGATVDEDNPSTEFEITRARPEDLCNIIRFVESGREVLVSAVQRRNIDRPSRHNNVSVRLAACLRREADVSFVWNYLGANAKHRFVSVEGILELSEVCERLLFEFAQQGLLPYAWMHMDEEGASLCDLRTRVQHNLMRHDIRRLADAFDVARRLGTAEQYIQEVFWGNYWRKRYVDALGGVKAVEEALAAVVVRFEEIVGGVYFTLSESVLDLKEKADARKVNEKRERVRAYLKEKRLLLPDRNVLDREWAERLSQRKAERGKSED